MFEFWYTLAGYMTIEKESMAQTAPLPTLSIKSILKWGLVFALLALGSIVAFGFTPRDSSLNIEQRRVTEEIDISEWQAPPTIAYRKFQREIVIKRGDTLTSLLKQLRIDDTDLERFILNSKEIKRTFKLKIGDAIRATVDNTGHAYNLTLLPRNSQPVRISPTTTGYAITGAPTTKRMTFGTGVVRNSLYGSFDENGIPEELAAQMAEIFSSEIDFNRDIRSGDRFTLVYSSEYLDDAFVSTGTIEAAEFTNKGETFQAFLFMAPETGEQGYYTRDGKNVKRSFLRSPLKFSRITSGFSKGRLHPVLKKWRAHKGVDYGAPTGTPIMATGKGVIKYLGRKGGYGRFIEIRHANGISTRYAHLSRYAKRLKKGSSVSQGQIIGYVGKSGLATGPHLHYEFLANGTQINPTKAVMPPGPSITKSLKDVFQTQIEKNTTLLDTLNRRYASSK